MNGLTRLHMIAAARGDGLRPELLALLRRCDQAGADKKIETLASYRSDAPVQAGPSPVTRLGETLPEGVLAFPANKHPSVEMRGNKSARRKI